MKTWTDYPITALGDTAGQEAPVRECKALAYDGDKYLLIEVGGVLVEVKSGYVYRRPGRRGPSGFFCRDGGWLPRAPCLSPKQLRTLPQKGSGWFLGDRKLGGKP